ncbi:MAG: restriction endonuclease subunit S, partial [Burkholderiales bacterium]|nr:restriction endonuclease subunit S [Burkholderiales bacterium]
MTDHLDLWTSALLVKSTAGRGSGGPLEAYGVNKLRTLILELAVRGKLLPQDPNDEPATTLLKRIAAEKVRLIKEGVVKRVKPLPDIVEAEKDFELPMGWVFVRLGDIAFSQAGFAFKSRYFNESAEGLPLIRIRDVGQPFTGTYYSGEYRDEFIVEQGDYLISMDGEFRVSPWANGRALLNQRVSRLIFFTENLGKRFIADSLQTRLRKLQGVKAYTTVDHLSGAQITESVIGLPPLAEQRRIVAKVDELMALCDQLEQQQGIGIEAHQTLVETLLGTLTRVESAQEFAAAWNRIAEHFDTLFTTEHSIDQLKHTILQLAVMGKLVSQNPIEEPANALLAAIASEKEALVAEGRIGRQKLYPDISEEERRFVAPLGWQWVRLDSLFNVIVDCP